MKQTPYMIEIHFVNNLVDTRYYNNADELEETYQQLRDIVLSKKHSNLYVEFYEKGKLVNLDNVIFIEKKIITP